MRFMHSSATGGSAACFLFLFLSHFLPLNPSPSQSLSQAGLQQTAGCSDLTREGGAAEAGRRGKAPSRLPSPGQEEKRPMENESLPPLPTFSPAVPPYVKLGLTVAYTVFYSLLFVFVYAQLWLVLRYRHKRFSYQTVFLFLCLLLPLYLLFLCISIIFLLVNLTCALLVKMTKADTETVVLVRVAINDTLFVLCAVSLSLCLYKIAKMSLANIYLESKGTSVCQVTVIGVTVILLYSSRACYNLVVLALTKIKSINSFDYDWYNVSDQADLKSTLGDAGYVVFGVILFVWELLPTSLVVFFFRVRKPAQDRSAAVIPGHMFSSRAYFFDNPRRYDSDDDLAWSIIPQNIQASLTPDSYDWSSQNNSFTAYVESEDSRLVPEELNPY
ncbi:Integral membrane protein GPR137B [Anabarilius grahami]|uniref:Integral membrane protein GPR137B n=1 Tax=Anabarilius grahami TaxID=495550 RepID=A0A3N0XXB7_ANAGA|nr:Integral membrane protein GPR137B [Anabarilius grahami]